jgi:chromosome partitioning protein
MANKNSTRATPYVIALCHQKGGVAKTTTALSLGACFAEQGLDTLLIDLDPQGNSTGALGFNPAAIFHSAADVLLGNGNLVGISRETATARLDIVPANADMLTVDRCLHLRSNFEYVLRDQLSKPALAHYTVVVLDCPPALGSLAATALTASDIAIVPTQCEYFSIQAIKNTLKLVETIRSKTNPKLMHRLLVTMFDGRIGLHHSSLEQIRKHFSKAVFKTVINIDGKLRESQLMQQPITSFATHSRAAQNYRQLTQELLKYV